MVIFCPPKLNRQNDIHKLILLNTDRLPHQDRQATISGQTGYHIGTELTVLQRHTRKQTNYIEEAETLSHQRLIILQTDKSQ